ncbi:adenine nucleotide alpha hydrolases-like protein, partial [Amniculicola lignicola CBS 123094]
MAGLNVIALISGGKDSFFSILHCLANGGEVTALANLHPVEDEEDDINSYMYQTVGHTIIPLYAQALNLPLYRQEILGSVVNTSKDYAETGNDETESITLLLKKVLKEHPEANAVSTGAILSTYQRTRVESVAVRLGLTPLSYLWQYPVLPPYEQASLLRDMAAVGQDARIIKVASGGLDQSFLWENVAEGKTIKKLGRAMARFGENGDGAVLGEGGEFETLAVDGPGVLWKGKIEIEGCEVVGGEGGSAIWKGRGARVVEKEEGSGKGLKGLRIPDLWDEEFKKILEKLDIASQPLPTSPSPVLENIPSKPHSPTFPLSEISSTPSTLTISNLNSPSSTSSPADQLSTILPILRTTLTAHNLTPSHITHTTLLLRHMSTFASINNIYSTLFTTPNPPSRVTVACGSTLPLGVDVMLSAICSTDVRERKGLHVQSRSYWAPANIGPYSQAISVPLKIALATDEDTDTKVVGEAVYLAGQIPLVPASMLVHTRSFAEQAVLSLQHLFRIGR